MNINLLAAENKGKSDKGKEASKKTQVIPYEALLVPVIPPKGLKYALQVGLYMKKKDEVFILILNAKFSIIAMSIIYQTFTPGEARFKAAIVKDPGIADIVVYITGTRGMAIDESHWFITNNRNEFATKIYFGNIGFSDLKVFFTKHIGKAGWQKDHNLKGKL